MATLNEEYEIHQFEHLGDSERLDYRPNEGYQPHRELTFYPGGQLSAERRKALDDQAVDPEDLTTDDIVYCLSRLATLTMYELIDQIELRWGKEAAKDVVYQWARKRGREAIKKWMGVRGLERISPESWARYQDFRHLISGPIHAHSFVSYVEGDGDEDIVEMNRTGCFFHCGRPEGSDSYSRYVSLGMNEGYNEAFPEISFRFVYCMSDGTSEHGCKAQFRIKRPENEVGEQG